jgi:copper(I)-binding protein
MTLAASLRPVRAVAAALLVAASVGWALAAEVRIGDLVLADPYARATPAGAKVGGGYVEIRNTGSEPDRLVSGTVSVAESVALHEMALQDGVMTMRERSEGMDIPAGGTLSLKPGAAHIMFVDLTEPLVAGTVVRGTLTFERAGTVDLEYPVQPLGGAVDDGHQAGHGSMHGD